MERRPWWRKSKQGPRETETRQRTSGAFRPPQWTADGRPSHCPLMHVQSQRGDEPYPKWHRGAMRPHDR